MQAWRAHTDHTSLLKFLLTEYIAAQEVSIVSGEHLRKHSYGTNLRCERDVRDVRNVEPHTS